MSIPDYAVRIGGTSASGRAFTGTGFYVDKSGLVATCLHVALPEGQAPRELWVENQQRRWKYELHLSNPLEDIAVLESVVPIPEGTHCAVLDGAWRDTCKPGDEVSVWGCSAAEHYSAPQKIACHVSGFAGEYGRIGLNGSVNPGDSGAPVLNAAGLVIGIAQLRDSTREGQAMAIPVSYLISLLPGRTLSGNPYPGLEYFDIGQSDRFFGREALVAQLLARFGDSRFLGLIGPVGSGKSSLARAGLLAAIRQGAIEGSGRWPLAVCRPGSNPLESLAYAVAKTHGTGAGTKEIAERVEEFHANRRTLHRTSIEAAQRIEGSVRVVLLVDQFEEIFTQCGDETQRAAFIANLTTAASDKDGCTIVVLTLRADFYGECSKAPELAELLSRHQALLGPMSADELRLAIVKPAAKAGAEFEHGLAELLLDEVRGQPGSLPLLGHALGELWRLRDGKLLTHAAYQSIGGVRGAVERRAEDIYGSLNEAHQATLKRMMLRLVQSNDGTAATRRRLRIEDLPPADGDAAEVNEVIRRMIEKPALLLASGGCVDIAHEALIRNWKRLGEWLDSDREFQLWQRRFCADVDAWENSARHADGLVRGKRLVEAKSWLETRRSDLNRSEREFITAAVSAENARLAREARRNFAFRVLASVLAVMFLAAAATAVIAWRETRLARSLALAASSEARTGTEALRMALDAFSNADTPESEQALYRAVKFVEGAGYKPCSSDSIVLGMAYSGPSGLLAFANSDGFVGLGNECFKPAGGARAVGFLPGGKSLVVGTDRHSIVFVDAQREIALSPQAEINAIDVNSTGNAVAAGTQDAVNPVALISFPAGAVRLLSCPGGPVKVLHFVPPDGRILAAVSVGGALCLWDSASGKGLPLLQTDSQLISFAVSPDGVVAAAGDTSGRIHLFDLQQRAQTHPVVHSENASVKGVAFSTDGKLLASASQDGTLKLWKVSGSKFAERVSMPCGKPDRREKQDLYGCAALLFTGPHTLQASDRDGNVREYETDPAKLFEHAKALGKP